MDRGVHLPLSGMSNRTLLSLLSSLLLAACSACGAEPPVAHGAREAARVELDARDDSVADAGATPAPRSGAQAERDDVADLADTGPTPAAHVDSRVERATASAPRPRALADAGTDEAPAASPRRARERFFQHADAPIREALSEQPIAEVERGRGGRSLSFRITLADGTRGYFKPSQTFNAMRWQSEIAAYHLDRELGLGRVAPVVGRSIPWSELEDAARGDGRIDELRVVDGAIPGAFVWWVPGRILPVELPDGWEQWLRVEGRPARLTPFQRPGQYRRGVTVAQPAEAPEPDTADRPAELSDMMVFDYLIQNVDRWGTNNTNIRTVGEGGPLMFLDNAGGFVLRSPRVPLMDERLAAVQRFRRSTIDAVRRLDVERFAARLADDPLAPELDQRQLRNLETRRAHLLAHVDRLVEEHGEDAVYAW